MTKNEESVNNELIITVDVILEKLQRMKDAGFGNTPVTINGRCILRTDGYYNYASNRTAKVNIKYSEQRDNVVYLCDGKIEMCRPEGCYKNGGPCCHTTKIDHAIHFEKVDDHKYQEKIRNFSIDELNTPNPDLDKAFGDNWKYSKCLYCQKDVDPHNNCQIVKQSKKEGIKYCFHKTCMRQNQNHEK